MLKRGFLFACTNKSESECLAGLVFGTEKTYGPVVIRIRHGDIIFLNNVETDVLHGAFRAVTDGGVSLKPDAFNGRYEYQVRVEPIGELTHLGGAAKLLQKYEFKRNTPIYRRKLSAILDEFHARLAADVAGDDEGSRPLLTELESIIHSNAQVDIEDEIPLVEATTFWDFPRQSYGLTPKGNNKYAGVTPALIIYNMVWRYTEPGETVVDPMCGSGTTLDVCSEEKRRGIGFDIHPTRPDITRNDARSIPLPDNSADMVFIDSPYGDNIKYNDEALNIGNISAESTEFYDELEKVMKESQRILREGKVLGWLIGDQWVKKKFTPVGFLIYERLCKYFEPVDIVCVSRRSQSSNTGVWHNRARRFNFYLRGFKYLIVMRKGKTEEVTEPRKISWARYSRGNKDE
ncbi:MAG: DNA methylase [Chloroflexi bacterium]|nr:DNA methylase [Chloroflexota bacterium]